MTESHRSSWFSIDGIEKLSTFLRGTLTGTSLADIVFIVTLARVLDVVDVDLAKRGLLQHVDNFRAADYFPLECEDVPIRSRVMYPAWVDDYDIVSLALPQDIVSRASCIFSCVQEVFHRYAMDLKMKKGKTECIFMVKGPGSLAVQRDLATLGSALQCRGCEGALVDLDRFFGQADLGAFHDRSTRTAVLGEIGIVPGAEDLSLDPDRASAFLLDHGDVPFHLDEGSFKGLALQVRPGADFG